MYSIAFRPEAPLQRINISFTKSRRSYTSHKPFFISSLRNETEASKCFLHFSCTRLQVEKTLTDLCQQWFKFLLDHNRTATYSGDLRTRTLDIQNILWITILYIARSTSISVPHFPDVFSVDGIVHVVQEFIDAPVLEDTWHNLSPDQKVALCRCS